MADFAVGLTRCGKRPRFTAVRRDPRQAARRRSREDDVGGRSTSPPSIDGRVGQRHRRPACERYLLEPAVREEGEPPAIGREKRRAAIVGAGNGRRFETVEGRGRRVGSHWRRSRTRRAWCRRPRTREPAPTRPTVCQGAADRVNRAAGTVAAWSPRVRCQTAATATSAQMAAALHGTSWPPIDGETAGSTTGASTGPALPRGPSCRSTPAPRIGSHGGAASGCRWATADRPRAPA